MSIIKPRVFQLCRGHTCISISHMLEWSGTELNGMAKPAMPDGLGFAPIGANLQGVPILILKSDTQRSPFITSTTKNNSRKWVQLALCRTYPSYWSTHLSPKWLVYCYFDFVGCKCDHPWGPVQINENAVQHWSRRSLKILGGMWKAHSQRPAIDSSNCSIITRDLQNEQTWK